MPRYIDADKLKERLMVGSELDPEPCKGFRNALLAMVDTQEDANVVPVVRCNDCVHYWKNYLKAEVDDAVAVCLASPKDDAFCSEGERRDDGTDAG